MNVNFTALKKYLDLNPVDGVTAEDVQCCELVVNDKIFCFHEVASNGAAYNFLSQEQKNTGS